MSSFTINQVKRKKKLVRVEKVLVLLFFFCTVTQGNKHTFVCLIATYSTETVLFLNITQLYNNSCPFFFKYTQYETIYLQKQSMRL